MGGHVYGVAERHSNTHLALLANSCGAQSPAGPVSASLTLESRAPKGRSWDLKGVRDPGVWQCQACTGVRWKPVWRLLVCVGTGSEGRAPGVGITSSPSLGSELLLRQTRDKAASPV